MCPRSDKLKEKASARFESVSAIMSIGVSIRSHSFSAAGVILPNNPWGEMFLPD